MKLDLLNLTKEEIQASSKRVSSEEGTFVMYLQNNGIENFRWNTNDFVPWMSEDIEE